MASKKAPVKKKKREVKKQAKTAISDKHRLFAMHYALTENAEQSALQAGFTAATARKKAFAWVGQSRQESFYPDLFDEVQLIKEQHLKPKLEQQFEVTADKVLAELVKIGFSDVRKLFDDNNNLIDIKQLPDDMAAAVASVEIEALFEMEGKKKVQVGHTKKLKMWDKKGSLEMIGKHLGMWKEDGGLKLPPNCKLIVQSQGEAPEVKDEF